MFDPFTPIVVVIGAPSSLWKVMDNHGGSVSTVCGKRASVPLEADAEADAEAEADADADAVKDWG